MRYQDEAAVQDRRPNLVSVVIAARNAMRTLEEQLEGLRGQDYGQPWEIVVADNGSSDGTVDCARRWAERLPLRVVDASARRGTSFARNCGWRSSRGDLIAFCDADDVVAPRWLSCLVDAARGADLVGGPYEFRLLNACRGQPWWDGADLPVALGFLPFALGGNLAVWSDALTALGGFNETYAREQDVDLCWRAQLSSLRLGFAPAAVVHCRERTRLGETARQVYRNAYHQPHLYRDFQTHGVPRSESWKFPLRVGSLLARAPACAFSRARRHRWILGGCHELGRLAGSLRYRVLYL